MTIEPESDPMDAPRETGAVVLAAGRGTRLMPHTADRPKCMVELCGVPLLTRHISALRSAGVREVAIVKGHLADRIDAAGTRSFQNPRFAETNMVVTLFCARDAMSSERDLVISYGDIVFEPRVVSALLRSDAELAVVVDTQWRRLWEARMEDPLSDAESLRLDESGHIREIGAKVRDVDQVEAQYIGLTKVRADCVDRFIAAFDAVGPDERFRGRDRDAMYMTDFIQRLIDDGWEVAAVPTASGWLEVDTADDLEAYEDMAARGTLASFYDPATHHAG